MVEIGTITASNRPNDAGAAGDKLTLTIVIHSPKGRFAPGDTLQILNVSTKEQ